MKVRKIAILVDTSTGWGRRTIRGVCDYAAEGDPWDIWIEPKGRDEPITVPSDSYDGFIARVASEDLAPATGGL